MIDCKRLIALSAEYGVDLTAEQAERCDAYAALLVEWNQKMNLTGITDPEGMLVKHFLDSFTAARFLSAPARAFRACRWQFCALTARSRCLTACKSG